MKIAYLIPLLVGVCLGQSNPDNHASPLAIPEQKVADDLPRNDIRESLSISFNDLVKECFTNNIIAGFELLCTIKLPESITKLSEGNPKRAASLELLELLAAVRITNTNVLKAIHHLDMDLIAFYQQLKKIWSRVHAAVG